MVPVLPARRTGPGRLAAHRAAFARLLWQDWSPTWDFTEAEFQATAASFDNPDFIEVVVHSYRHRYGLAEGDPSYQESENRIAAQPVIDVPTVVLDGAHDTVSPPLSRAEHEVHFTNLIDYRCLDAGHNPAQENPPEFARAVTDLHTHLSKGIR